MFKFKKIKNQKSSGFTLIELMVSVGIFVFLTALLVAKYGSFNDGTLLTSMAYDVALTLRDAQSYGLNVQGYTPTSGGSQSFSSPYGVHFSSASGSNNQMILFADSDSSNVYSSSVDSAITTYTIKNGGLVSSLCVTNTPASYGDPCTSANHTLPTSLDITFKRPDPNAIIVAVDSNGNKTQYAYAEIQVENSGKTSFRNIVVRQTGEIAVNPALVSSPSDSQSSYQSPSGTPSSPPQD